MCSDLNTIAICKDFLRESEQTYFFEVIPHQVSL